MIDNRFKAKPNWCCCPKAHNRGECRCDLDLWNKRELNHKFRVTTKNEVREELLYYNKGYLYERP